MSMLKAQEQFTYLNRTFSLEAEAGLNAADQAFHTGFKPYIKSNLKQALGDSSDTRVIDIKSWVVRKAFFESLIIVDSGDVHLRIDPVFNIEIGKENLDGTALNTFNNTRGFTIHGDIGKKFSFFSGFRENQSRFRSYVGDFVEQRRIVPGQGAVKGFKEGGYDYAMSNGHISFTPSQYFNFQFGHGKNFIGDGYRSLLLSDNSFNYPFLKITTSFWKIKYTNLFASFQNVSLGGLLDAPHTYESGYQKKLGTFHFFSLNIGRKLELGLFESIVWQRADSTGTRGFDINYINPVIFMRPVEFSLGSPDNSLMGLNLKYRALKNMQLYGQVVVDDLNLLENEETGFFQNKYGYQLGLKYFNLLGIKNLHFQTEYNRVRPYTYSHKTPLQSYTHFNQPLAHPLGANFDEGLFLLNYQLERFISEFRISYAMVGADTLNSNWGSNNFLSDHDAERQPQLFSYGNFVGQGVKTNINHFNISVGYLINPVNNLNFSIGYSNRTMKSEPVNSKSGFLYFTLRSSISNFYYDF